MTNKTKTMYTVLGCILFPTLGIVYLGEKGIISNSPLLPQIGLFFFSLWLFVYARLSQKLGVYDFLGPILTFTQHRKPHLFIIMIYLTYTCAAFLLLGFLRILLHV